MGHGTTKGSRMEKGNTTAQRWTQQLVGRDSKGHCHVLGWTGATICTNSGAEWKRGYKQRETDKVSPRQARRKVAHVTTLSKQALWFAHSFGLEPEFVQFRKTATRSSLTVHLSDDPRSSTPPQPTEDDKEHILQVLYLLDKFAVSDELYHELRMLCPHLPASNRVKQARKEINDLLEYTRLPSPYPGAYRSFKATLVEKISNAVSNFTISS